jgi:hypothetical protein
VCWWLVSSSLLDWRIQIEGKIQAHVIRYLQLADQAWCCLIECEFPIPEMRWLSYQLNFKKGDLWKDVASELPHMLLQGQSSLGFVRKPKLDVMLHGSCRKPHFNGPDGLARVDSELQAILNDTAGVTLADWPSVLIMSGDQIYTDDVAGPMLKAIHCVVKTLSFPPENLPGLTSQQVHEENPSFYNRQSLLPMSKQRDSVVKILFKGARKPVFTSSNSQNHLITLAEVLSMYLLVWSPTLWRTIGEEWRSLPANLDEKHHKRWHEECQYIQQFIQHLEAVSRGLAHVPVAMIFDDHDVTDDWNLSADWEQTAYSNPLSKRMIGNAILGYLVCQGWGNCPDRFDATLLEKVGEALKAPGGHDHDEVAHTLIDYDHWNYQWDTEPLLLVLDTRTQRWWSETSPNHPSGLMDWEGMIEMQVNMLGRDSVVMVSPAPIFGVKLIEVIQVLFTWLGKPLVVDAENWMANRSAAETLLNMFRHRRTPTHFVILSGDVHYSFAYRIRIRSGLSRLWRKLSRRKVPMATAPLRRTAPTDPSIWQITSSGLSNQFPDKLLRFFDRLNNLLYHSTSPLNWFTKRSKLNVIPSKPSQRHSGQRLLNHAGLGRVVLSSEGEPVRISQLGANGEDVDFEPPGAGTEIPPIKFNLR